MQTKWLCGLFRELVKSLILIYCRSLKIGFGVFLVFLSLVTCSRFDFRARTANFVLVFPEIFRTFFRLPETCFGFLVCPNLSLVEIPQVMQQSVRGTTLFPIFQTKLASDLQMQNYSDLAIERSHKYQLLFKTFKHQRDRKLPWKYLRFTPARRLTRLVACVNRYSDSPPPSPKKS